MKKILLVALLVSPLQVALGQEAGINPEKILDLVMEAHDDGVDDALMLMTFFTGLFVAVATGVGLVMYNVMVKRIDAHMRSKILESEVRNMLRLGFLYYGSYLEMSEFNEEASLHSIVNASSYTSRALQMLNKLDESNHEIVDLKALSLTNLAYYLALRALVIQSRIDCLLQSQPDLPPSDPKLERLRKKLAHLRSEGKKFAESSAIYVESAERRKEMVNLKWWEVIESRLFALCICDDFFDREVARTKLDEMYRDSLVPQGWKNEIRKEWEPRLGD